MPSPFPGMDPYLEDPHRWRGFHLLMLSEFAALLQPQLNAIGYYVDVEEQVYLGEAGREIVPDAAVHHDPEGHGYDVKPAIAVVDEPILVEELREERVRHLEIRRTEDDHMVTVIELLSPANKLRDRGRDQYARKRRELTQIDIGFVEVDLLRAGPVVVDLPAEVLDRHPHDYVVNIIRPASTSGEFYPVRLRDRLPRVRIPLAADDPDAALDLQAALDAAYDRGPYRVRIDYSADPPPPRLPQDDLDWIDALLCEKGFRK